MFTESQKQQYAALTASAGFVLLPRRCVLTLTGDDRSKFLNNFCTADMTKLADGNATELFILDSRGKTLAFGHVADLSDSLLITTAAGSQSDVLKQHLDRYVIREDVIFSDETNTTSSFFVTGDFANQHFPSLIDLPRNQFIGSSLSEVTCRIGHVEIADFGFLVSCHSDDEQLLSNHFKQTGIVECDLDVLHAVRSQQGTPWLGTEVDDKNLPQELRRDDKSISFTKGCYLGQETVAKIDAFGHVNKFLVALHMDGDAAPAADTEIFDGDKKVGSVKSTSYSPILDGYIGLGFVKCKLAEAGTRLSADGASCTVVKLPIHS